MVHTVIQRPNIMIHDIHDTFFFGSKLNGHFHVFICSKEYVIFIIQIGFKTIEMYISVCIRVHHNIYPKDTRHGKQQKRRETLT